MGVTLPWRIIWRCFLHPIMSWAQSPTSSLPAVSVIKSNLLLGSFLCYLLMVASNLFWWFFLVHISTSLLIWYIIHVEGNALEEKLRLFLSIHILQITAATCMSILFFVHFINNSPLLIVCLISGPRPISPSICHHNWFVYVQKIITKLKCYFW